MPLRSIFDMDSGFFRVLSRVADLMILNLIFVACCIPIVTIGPALTAMYYVTLKMADNEEGYIVRGFFKSFRQNFRQALIIWVIMLLIGALLATDLLILREASGTLLQFMRVFILATLIVYLMVLIYVFPILARFENSVKATMKNALFMAILDFPRTILMAAIIGVSVFITLYNSYTFWYGILIWIMLGFACIAYVNSRFFTKIFRKYIPEEMRKDDSGELGELQLDEEEAEKAPGTAIPEINDSPERIPKTDTAAETDHSQMT